MTDHKNSFLQNIYKTVGPGLLFASAAIGTSHLVLSTRAGAHHGMIFFWIIAGVMLLKYPFYEFGPRYANATGNSLIKGYKDQGTWAVLVFLLVIVVSMFAVPAAIAAVCAGLLATIFGVTGITVPVLAGIILGISVLLLLMGGYGGLEKVIKFISVVLFVSVIIAFVAVLQKGQMEVIENFQPTPILEGAGLGLLIGLLGWMPAGMEASTMNSIWRVEKTKASGFRPSLRESLFDFNLGFVFTLLLALMFLTIGAFSVFGTGVVLDGNATQFSNKLLQIFVSNVGDWSYYIIAFAAFGAIYGTLLTVLDAYPRCFARGLRVLKYESYLDDEEQNNFIKRLYQLSVIIIGLGSFALFYFSATSMLQILEYVTILSFILSPMIAFLNLRVISSSNLPQSHRPSQMLLGLAYIGLIALTLFAVYYLVGLF